MSELSKEEKKELLGTFEQLSEQNPELLKNTFRGLSWFVRATEGKSIEPEEWITKFTDVKNIRERSDFPTYPMVGLEVYLTLLSWKYGDNAKACQAWAKYLAETMISYRRRSRGEAVEMSKKQEIAIPGQELLTRTTAEKQPKRRWNFLRRKSPQEESEFVSA